MTQSLNDAVASYPADTPDWAVAEALNAPDAINGTKRVDVQVSDARGLLMQSGAWAAMVLAAENTATPTTVRAAAITGRDSMLYLTEISTSQPAVYQVTSDMLAALVAGGIVSADLRDSLLALADRPMSWADLNNGGVQVTARDVGLARGGVA